VGYQFGDQVDRVHIDSGGAMVHREKGSAGDGKGTTYFLGFDARGRLWAGTNRGVDVRNANAAGWDHYDHHDGLVWDDCDLNGFHANEDGTVWIGTSGGLSLFTPRDAVYPQGPPVAILTKLTLGGKVVSGAKSIAVGHAANSLTARFSALTFAREEGVLFRYRLAPLFCDWRETRARELQFPGLPADSYRLEVQARDGWGRWCTESAIFSFDVLPPMWRAWWFLSLCAMLPIGIAIVAVRFRGNKMRRREQNLVRLVDARTAELRRTTGRLQEANRNLVRISSLDGLTGIAHRRVFDLTLEKEWERARRLGSPLSMVLADVDHFKRLNDLAGHQAGDEYLRLIAQTLAATARRGTDCVARFGGEEFALLLPGADAAQALLVAETARRDVEALLYPHLDTTAGIVTISLGVTTVIGGNLPTAYALVGAADEALYAAKQQGRNRVVARQQEAPELAENCRMVRGGKAISEPVPVSLS
jgi:diguanylate cyclase (GGDEF)-like protein